MKPAALRPKAFHMLEKSEYIAHHALRQMLEVEQYTELLEAVFVELNKHSDGTNEKRALSALARSLATSIVITMHAACFDLTRAKRQKGRHPKPSIAGIMKGDKASFCDAVALLDGNAPKSVPASNLAIKRRVAYDANWKNWVPFMRFKEEDGTDAEIPFPIFDGELGFHERIQSQREAQRESIETWKKLCDLPSFLKVKHTRNKLYAHLNPKALNHQTSVSSFRDVIDLSRHSLAAMRQVCKVHFGMHRELNGVRLSDAFGVLMNNSSKNKTPHAGQSDV